MTEVLSFEEAKTQVTVTEYGVVIDTMQGRVCLSQKDAQKMAEWLVALNYGEVGPQ